MTTVRRPRTIYANASRAARPLPEASGRERFWWYFMRLSGLALQDQFVVVSGTAGEVLIWV